jgi:hypothetical protein
VAGEVKGVRRRTADSASNATKRDSKAKRKKPARTDVLLLEFTCQVALQDEQDQQTIFFFFDKNKLTFTNVVFPVPPSPTVLRDIRSRQK